MSDRLKSFLSFGLAALAIVCATVLRALGAVEAQVLMFVFSLAFTAVGFHHAAAPGQGGAVPPGGTS